MIIPLLFWQQDSQQPVWAVHSRGSVVQYLARFIKILIELIHSLINLMLILVFALAHTYNSVSSGYSDYASSSVYDLLCRFSLFSN